MSAPATTTELLVLLRKSGLVDEATFAEMFPDESDLPDDPRTCAAGLVARGLLTRYQAKMLIAGKSRGFLVGQYVIQSPIGQGGMGIVYLARHVSLDRQVALKVLSNDRAQDKLHFDRFQREARAAAALDHPNIVRLHDISQGAGVHFLVMEYVDGTNIHDMITKTGALHYAQAVQYIAQAAAGLHHAHEKGFVHRDVKPANMMVTKTGVVKLLDLGLARSLTNEEDNLTGLHGNDDITGTPDFISPEQLLGEPSDARTDIYSLGATLFALVVGQPPFSGTTTQKLAQHQSKDPEELRKRLRGKAPVELADVIVKMMAKRKADRFQSADAVIDALTPGLPAETTGNIVKDTAARASEKVAEIKAETKRTKRRKRLEKQAAARKKWLVIGGSVGAVALVGVIALIAGLGDKNAANAFNGPVGQFGAGGPPGGNGGAPRSNDPPALRGHADAINDLVFRSDGKVASVDWKGGLVVWDSNTGLQVHSTKVMADKRLTSCASTPDGKHLLIAGDNMPILVVDWNTGKQVREFPGHGTTTWSLAVSPSGKEFASCGTDGTVLIRDLTTGDEIRRFEFDAKQVWCVAFSPDGKRIAASTAKGTLDDESFIVRVWETATGRELARLNGHTGDVRWISFHPNGKGLASASFDGTVRIWDVDAGKLVRTIGAHNGYVERVFFLGNGQRLISCGGLSNGQDGGLRIWDAESGREVKGWQGNGANGLLAMAVSANGSLIATGCRDRVVRIWRAD
jgi:tRNA A-37 threonylcarbamoyl transferase component Bud32/outer membrane protein assembly factor BamB